jgi:phosphohistidine phosphatase
MKTIYLIRHAKSSWKNPNLPDFERPLNKRGKKDALFIGGLLKRKNIYPDLILSSPAVRTKDTAIEIADSIGFTQNKIIFKNELYEATVRTLISIIKEIDERYNSVMLFAHNPGLTNLNNYISNKFIENIPTCGLVALGSEIEWSKTDNETFKFLYFEYPKKYKQ